MQKLFPAKSAAITEYYADQNCAALNDHNLYISRFAKPGDSYRSLLQFDLSYIPQSAPIEKAYLQLNIFKNLISSSSIKVGIYRLLEEWNEKTITWNSMVPFATVPEQFFIIPAVWTGLIIVDVTKLAINWVNRYYTNRGIILIGSEYQNNLVAFYGLEETDKTRQPMLIIK